jgi:hypothetical protein
VCTHVLFLYHWYVFFLRLLHGGRIATHNEKWVVPCRPGHVVVVGSDAAVVTFGIILRRGTCRWSSRSSGREEGCLFFVCHQVLIELIVVRWYSIIPIWQMNENLDLFGYPIQYIDTFLSLYRFFIIASTKGCGTSTTIISIIVSSRNRTTVIILFYNLDLVCSWLVVLSM